MKIARIPDSPWCAALSIACIYLLVLLFQLRAHDGDPSYFIDIGDWYTLGPGFVPPDLHVAHNSTGYDGQFYYQLALNPFSPQEVNSGLRIDNGPYRHQRILYPLLVWLFSFGNRDYVPAMLLILNYLALCAIAWLGGLYAQMHQGHALWGGLFGLYPGFLFTLTHDLTEIFAMLFLLAGIISMERSPRQLNTALLLTLAMLTRETTLIAVLALGMGMALRRESGRWSTVVAPLAAYGVWQLALWAKWGQPSVWTAGILMGFPGRGLVDFIGTLNLGNWTDRIWVIELVYLAAIVFAALGTKAGPLEYRLMLAGSASMIFALSSHVWIADVAYMRAASEFYLFGLILIVLTARFAVLGRVAVCTALTWGLVLFTRLNW